MTDRTRREHTMKRIAAILATVVAIGIVPSVASAGSGSTVQVKAQVTAQVRVQQRPQRVSAAVVVQQIRAHRAQLAAIRLAVRLRSL